MQGTKARGARRRKKALLKRVIAYICASVILCIACYYAGYTAGVNANRFKGSILLVNEDNPLPADYEPDGLVNLYEQRHSFRLASSQIYLTRETYEAMELMFAAAEAEEVNGFVITSGYRTYERQSEIYESSEPGYAQKPGASEHQTGLAFDVTAVNSGDGFESTEQYAWLRKNAHLYGFIQRYPANKAHITGISYEPWHYRYVGIDAAKDIYQAGVTLEEYLD